MRVACNSSPLIWLSHTGHFSLLQALFEVVLIPPEVRSETVERAMGYPNAETVRAACEAGWMVVVPPTDTSRVSLLRARNLATVMGLRVIGTAGILLLAHARGMKVDVKSALDEMRRRGFRLADTVYQ